MSNSDRSGHLTTDELQRALVNGDWQPFNIETVRLMMNLFDKDGSGTINFHEFSALWKYIKDWQQCFQSFDRDRSGSIDKQELKQALYQFGYNVSDRLVEQTIKKFDRSGK
jgi:Ca2+-binding EF-hand superfamily protein